MGYLTFRGFGLCSLFRVLVSIMLSMVVSCRLQVLYVSMFVFAAIICIFEIFQILSLSGDHSIIHHSHYFRFLLLNIAALLSTFISTINYLLESLLGGAPSIR